MSQGLRRAALSTGSAQYVIYALSFVRLIVISRILTSTEIGAFVLASSLVLLASVPRVFGTIDYIITRTELTEVVLRTCFTILVASGALIGALYLLGAPRVADFFGYPVISDLLQLMALSFLILPFGIIGQAMLRRQMRFGALALARVVGAIVETCVALGLILYAGWGVMSMAWGFFAANITVTGIVIALAPHQTLFKPGLSDLRDVAQFGARASAADFLTHLGELGPPLLLGRGFDASSVGFFSRGQTLINFFRQGVETAMAPVVQPWFARHGRDAPELVAGGYARIMGLVSVVTWPFYAYVFVHAPTLIPLLLGAGWDASIPVTRALAVAGLFSPYTRYADSLLIGLGKVNTRLALVVAIQVIRFGLLGIGIVAGHGLIGFAWALTLGSVAAFALALWTLHRTIGLSTGRMLGGLQTPLLMMVAIIVVNSVLVTWLGPDWTIVLLSAVVTAVVWVGLLAMMRHSLLDEIKSVIARRFQKG